MMSVVPGGLSYIGEDGDSLSSCLSRRSRRCSWPPATEDLVPRRQDMVIRMDKDLYHKHNKDYIDSEPSSGFIDGVKNEDGVFIDEDLSSGVVDANVIQGEGVSGGTVGSGATVLSVEASRKKRIASIFQHYYPEGGWGIVVLVCATMVQVLVHGLQLSFGVLSPWICRKFRTSVPETGQSSIFSISSISSVGPRLGRSHVSLCFSPPLPHHHLFLSPQVNPPDCGGGRSGHCSRLSLHFLLYSVPSTLLQLWHYCW